MQSVAMRGGHAPLPRGGRGGPPPCRCAAGGTPTRLRGRVAPMTRVVLSIGSNIGDRLARLQSVLDALGDAVQAVSPVYETAAWGGVEQGPFLNAVLIAEDPTLDGHGWLHLAQEMEG